MEMVNNVITLTRHKMRYLENFTEMLGYPVKVIRSKLEEDIYKDAYGSKHSSVYNKKLQSKNEEFTIKLILPRSNDLYSNYNDTEVTFEIYNHKDELELGDVLEFSLGATSNIIYRYKVIDKPMTYYGGMYKYTIESLYISNNI